METRRVLQVDAFAEAPLSGNPAGVVPDGGGLTDDQMHAVAREMALSETAFLRPSERADRRIRYFTPTQEVDLCGHATIGSFAHLHDAGELGHGTTTLETNAGVIDVDVDADGTVWMTQGEPSITEREVPFARVAESLGLDREALRGPSDDLPIAVASTGLPFLVVPITYLSDLGDANPSMADVESLAEEVDAVGIYVFTFDTLRGDSTLHGRMFAPGAGVPEDPVTGTASGAVGAYLERAGAFEDVPEELVFEQGHFIDRPGTVRVRVGDEVRVGGRAVTSLDGSIVIPPADDTEIVEAS